MRSAPPPACTLSSCLFGPLPTAALAGEWINGKLPGCLSGLVPKAAYIAAEGAFVPELRLASRPIDRRAAEAANQAGAFNSFLM